MVLPGILGVISCTSTEVSGMFEAIESVGTDVWDSAPLNLP